MSAAADSFKPPCILGYYPCISNPMSKDCAIIDTCSKDLFFCKFAKLAYADGTDISCKDYSFTNRNCTHGGGLGKGGTVTLYLDGKPAGKGHLDGTTPIIFSLDDKTNVVPYNV